MSWKKVPDMKSDSLVVKQSNQLRKALMLYAITDKSWVGQQSLVEQVEQTIQGGTTMLQYREKNRSRSEVIAETHQIKEVCAKYRVPFVINDDVLLAVELNADGVHVGQSDMDVADVRSLIGSDMLLGVSVQNVDQAIKAQNQGADYLGVGAVFPTGSKDDADEVSHETLRMICEAVSIPVVAIGGINRDNVEQLAGSGISGVAVISAIFAQTDIFSATKELRKLAQLTVKYESVSHD
jgi:thiamine-phosphate pyrophosphorylase